jgi:hypothetical protein
MLCPLFQWSSIAVHWRKRKPQDNTRLPPLNTQKKGGSFVFPQVKYFAICACAAPQLVFCIVVTAKAWSKSISSKDATCGHGLQDYSRIAASLGGTFLWAHACFLECASRVSYFCFALFIYPQYCSLTWRDGILGGIANFGLKNATCTCVKFSESCFERFTARWNLGENGYKTRWESI